MAVGRRIMESLDAVTFDAAGTLVRMVPSFPELFAGVCQRHGLEVTAEQVARAHRRLAPLANLAPEAGLERGPTASPEDARRFWTYAYRRILEEMGLGTSGLEHELYVSLADPGCYALFDDARPVLERLAAAGLRLAVVSNFDPWLEEILRREAVRDLFASVVVSACEGVEKPDPEIYRRALARLGADPRRALHVGDSLAHDVWPALETGMRAVLVDRFGQHPQPGCPRIASLAELPAWMAGAGEVV